MKSTILVILFTAMAAFCFGIFQVDLGFDVAGNHTIDVEDFGSQDYDVGMGISPSVEYMMQYQSILYGLGLEYQLQRKIEFDGEELGKFGFIPIYLVGRYQFTLPGTITPEAVAQLGYNIFTANDDYKGDGDLSGGLYYGIGAGVTIQKKYLVQLMYKANAGGWEYSGLNADMTNSQINLGLGYRF
jgi:hypothetical protein